MKNPKLSIVIPFHFMDNWHLMLTRCLGSIEMQTFMDYEILIAKVSTMPVTSNRVIESAKGDLIKVLYMDDYLAKETSLQEIVNAFDKNTQWLVSGCVHDDGSGQAKNPHQPLWTDNIITGNNKIGSPSVLTMRRKNKLSFDENMSWLLDCDLYKRLHDIYGEPKILESYNVAIGIHKGQTSNTLSQEDKQKEHDYLLKKYSHV